MADSGAVDLVLANPIRIAACECLSTFCLSLDDSVVKNDARNLTQRRHAFKPNLRRVREVNNGNFFLLGTEIADTHENVDSLGDVIDARLKAQREAQFVSSVHHFIDEFLAIATDNSQVAEVGATNFNQCSGTNCNKLCQKGFSTSTVEALLCLTSLFYDNSIPAVRNCLVDSVLLPKAPQAFHLAEGLYRVISRSAR